MPLYKYRANSARALEMLILRELYFAAPASLNDPYDCRIDIRASLAAAIDRATEANDAKLRSNFERLRKMEHVYEKMDADLGKLGVLSFGKRPDSVLMWSHYAENHKGFCVGFELSEKFMTHRNQEKIVGAIDVSYICENPYVDYFNEIVRAENPPEWDDFWQSLLSMGMVAKSKAWEYEEEVRVLRKSAGGVPFTPAELTEVIFGLNMSGRAREVTRKLLSGDEWAHVRFREAYRTHDFTLRLRDAT